MLNIFSKKQATQSARALEKFFAKHGIELNHSRALEALAVLAGKEDWNSLAYAMSEEGVNASLQAFEVVHLRNSADNDYGQECAIVTHTGFQLRYSADEDTPSYVRVTDPLGREIAYWISDELQEDPELVMGAILGALARGKPIVIDGKTQRQVQKPVTFQDVPWDSVQDLLYNGKPYFLNWANYDRLKAIAEVPEGEDGLICFGALDKHGFTVEFELTAEDLRGLRWNPSTQDFQDEEGNTFVFLMSQRFGA